MKKHKAELPSEFEHLLSDSTGPKPKKTPKGSLGLWTNRQIHDSIKPTKNVFDKVKFTTSLKPSVKELKFNQALAFPPNLPKVASGIDKDSIISLYANS